MTILSSTDFSGDTTDFSQVDMNNISNLVIENSQHGRINFSEDVDLGVEEENKGIPIEYIVLIVLVVLAIIVLI